MADPAGTASAAAHVVDAVRRRRPALRGQARVVGIDGPAGSGKTTLAASVEAAARARGEHVVVLRMDDLYEGWSGAPAVGPRVEAMLASLDTTGRTSYRRYDWHLGQFAEEHEVTLPDLLVMEGAFSCPPGADPWVSLRVWVEAPRAVRLARGLERDGEHLRSEWVRFMADEDHVHARDRTRERAEVLVDGVTGEVMRRAPEPPEPR